MPSDPLYQQEGAKAIPRLVPVYKHFEERSGALVKPNVLWDNSGYLLGLSGKKKMKLESRKFVKTKQDHHQIFDEIQDTGLQAVLRFFDKWSPEEEHPLVLEHWANLADSFAVFRLDGERGFIHDRPLACQRWDDYYREQASTEAGRCLVSGSIVSLARIHPAIKGVRGAQSKGASIISFNKKSFESYNKKQSFNAPVSEKAAFAYTTALNALLAKDSKQKVQVGDATVVFWAERSTQAEDFLAKVFDMSDTKEKSENDLGTILRLRSILKAITQGKHVSTVEPDLDENVHFYILGLSPNASRLSVRFWLVDTLGELLKRIARYYEDLSIVLQYESDPDYPPLWRLLCNTATQGKSENVSPVLSGAMAQAMLKGSPYPQSLLPIVIGRIRAEREVGYYKAALLKAFLRRNRQMEDITMSLDKNRTDEPYLLGRLFSVLEKAQEEAIPKANATIKDHYFGSASASPAQVFHMLIKNSSNHISKLRKNEKKKKLAHYYDNMIRDILDEIDEFSPAFKPEEQGLFMIGYYHQRKSFFTKKDKEA